MRKGLLLLLLLLPGAAPQDDPSHDRIIGDIVAHIRNAPKGEAATLAALFQRWFPERDVLDRYRGKEGVLSEEGFGLLKVAAAQMADLGRRAKQRGNGVAAGMEAFRALNFDPGNRTAAGILGYVDGRPKREKELKEKGLTKTRWGWILKDLYATWKPGLVPDGGQMISEKDSDAAHNAWSRARKLNYTFITVTSDLPLKQVEAVGTRLDWFLEWLRSRFLLVDGYQEPSWPIQLWIPASTKDFNEEKKIAKNPGVSSFGVSFYPGRKFVLVNGETTPKTTETLEGVSQHECTHAFFALAFGDQPGRKQPFIWATEGFPTFCSYISPDHPVDGNIVKILKQKFRVGDWRRREVDRLIEGEDVLGELKDVDELKEPKIQLQSMVMGSCVSAFALSDPKRREKYAEFLATYFAGRVKKGDFTKIVEPSDRFSKAMGVWLTSRGK